MPANTVYKIISSDHRENAVNACLEINKNSEVFTGHFPGHPVLPGACMLQMIKEVLESRLNTSLRLKRAAQMKFLRVIEPGVRSILELTLTYHFEDEKNVAVTADLAAAKNICFKFRGSFIAQ